MVISSQSWNRREDAWVCNLLLFHLTFYFKPMVILYPRSFWIILVHHPGRRIIPKGRVINLRLGVYLKRALDIWHDAILGPYRAKGMFSPMGMFMEAWINCSSEEVERNYRHRVLYQIPDALQTVWMGSPHTPLSPFPQLWNGAIIATSRIVVQVRWGARCLACWRSKEFLLNLDS